MNIIKKNILFSREKNVWVKHKVKITSTLIALFIWFLIVSGGTFDYTVSIPISCPNNDQNYILINELPKKGRVMLRGQGIHLLIYMIFHEGRLVLEPDWATGKKVEYPTEKNIILTGNAQKLQILKLIEPDSIELQIERLIVKELPIQNNIQVLPQAGYTLVDDIKIEPDLALIKGPKSVIDTFKTISTDNLVLENLKYPVHKQINLISPNIENLSLLNQKATLSADIQKLMEKKISNIPVGVINLPPNVSALVIPAHFSLVIQGGVNVVFPINEKDIEAYIDYKKHRNPDRQDYPAYIKPIPGIRFRDIEPKRFKIILERD
ncbi:YbbR-like domain-containing protein [candidate division KSB1 bacterium]|nr:YbbR-like domain-containing protein [candidate division KSB1 bacterium]